MSAREDLKAIQAILKFPEALQDGVPGPQTSGRFSDLCALALEELHAEHDLSGGGVLRGKIGNFAVSIEGEDLWVRHVRSTCFGGSGDSMDSGNTASGYPTKGHPKLQAASLPMNYKGPDVATRRALSGSPIPLMAFGLTKDGKRNPDGAWVQVFFANGEDLTVPVIDLGPNIRVYPDNAIDLTIAAARVANPKATANNFEAIVDYRIIGGTRWV